MLTRRKLVLALLAVPAAPVLAQKAMDAEARAFVEGLIATLAAIDAKGGDAAARDRARDAALTKAVALDRIGRFMLGASRTIATPAELADYERLVPGFILADVRGEIAKLVAQSIAIDGVQLRSDRDALVRSRFRRKTGGLVRVDWRVQRMEDGAPRLVDVYVNGVSRFVIRRDEFQSVAKSGGMPALLARVKAGPT
jgi:phospholipid transport system substrate-binding protein